MFSVNGQFFGNLQGIDRSQQTTPDLESSDVLKPWLPVSYPAPYLPTLRQIQDHPSLASIVIGAHMLLGQDKNGALVPAGLFCGSQATKANGGDYCVLAYQQLDVNFVTNPQTGNRVASANEYVVLAAPSDGAAGDTVTLPSGRTITITAGDLAFALACDLFAGGRVKPVGVAEKNVYMYLGGVLLGKNTNATDSTHGINYVLDPMNPVNYVGALNYMHEMGTSIRTQYAIKLPWIGATPTTLQTLANTDGVVGYVQGIGRSFTHFTGAIGATPGFHHGSAIVASHAGHGTDAGNYAPFDPTKNTVEDVVGRVIGIENLNPVGFMNRVRSPFDRPTVGPRNDPNPNWGRMGGSSTEGIPVHINLTTDGAFPLAVRQGKTLHPEYSTHVIVRVNL